MKYFRNLVFCFLGHPFYSGVTIGNGFQVKHQLSGALFQTSGHKVLGTKQDNRFRIGDHIFFFLGIVLVVLLAILLGWFVQLVLAFFVNSAEHSFQPRQLFAYLSLGAGLLILIYIIAARFVGITSRKQEYHACEHKVILCASNRLEPTPEALKAIPKSSAYCGVSIRMLLAETLLFVGFNAIVAGGQGGAWGIAGSIFSISFLAGASTMLILVTLSAMKKQVTTRFVLLVLPLAVISLPIWILPLLIEQLLFLKEPSDEILQEGVELAQRMYEELGITPQS